MLCCLTENNFMYVPNKNKFVIHLSVWKDIMKENGKEEKSVLATYIAEWRSGHLIALITQGT